MFKLCCVLIFAAFISVSSEGEKCIKDGVSGSCVILGQCEKALLDLQNRKRPQICSFSGREPVVCCLDQSSTRAPPLPVATTTKRPSTTTEYIPPINEYVDLNGNAGGSCVPLDPKLSAPRNGKKAWDKCIEYQENLVHPCEQSTTLTGSMTRTSHCHHKTDGLIINGVDADQYEFPHMALLGFGETPGNWVCAGTILSETFILTAGHCTYSRSHASAATFARVNVRRKFEQENPNNIYKIIQIIKHPEYNPPNKYHDLALVKTDRPIALNEYVVPACLDVRDGVSDDEAIATGWGLTKYNGQESDILQKVNLQKFTDSECSTFYRVGERNMLLGYQRPSQVCFGHKKEAKDTCQGDSGGPLQVRNRKLDCMYTIIGVTSFGKGCGTIGLPAIYTRITYYVDWIENIVWP